MLVVPIRQQGMGYLGDDRRGFAGQFPQVSSCERVVVATTIQPLQKILSKEAYVGSTDDHQPRNPQMDEEVE